jgi:hypothetical protein
LATPVINNIAVFCVPPSFAMASWFPGELTNIEANRLEKTGIWSEDDDNILTRKAKSTASFAFEGTKAWIVGTMDQDSGNMNVYIDDFLTGTVSLQNPVKVRRRVLFQTDDLANCHHLIKIESVTSDPISIHGFHILDNHGRGMFEIEHEKYDISKGLNVTLRVVRVGGSAGIAAVTIQTLPDTAVQDRDYVDMTTNLTFHDGESSHTISIETLNRHHSTGNLTFLAEIVDPSDGAVLGLKRSAMITMMEPGNDVGGPGRGMAVAQKSDDSVTWLVVLIGCTLCIILAVTVKRRTAGREDEFSLLVPDQRLYVV